MRNRIGYVDATIHLSTPYDVGEKVAGILIFVDYTEKGEFTHTDFFLEAEVVEVDEEGSIVKLQIPKECMKLIKERTGSLGILCYSE